MAENTKPKALVIPPTSYPQMVGRAQAQAMSRALRSQVAAIKGAQVIADSGEMLRESVLFYVAQLEAAGSDLDVISEKAHEIRGMADTAGMFATGRIADGLCRYFDEAQKAGLASDEAVTRLHVSAISRSARDPDSRNQMSDVVARELAVLTARKLADAKAKNS